VFLVEVQEPTDFSILLEWSVTTATRDESHLGLGFDVVLPAVSHLALPAPEPVHVGLDARARDLLRGLPSAADPFFRVDIAAGDAVSVPHGFAVAVVLEDGELEWADGGQPITRGDVLAVPDGIGDWAATGRVVVCRPSAAWPEVA
jgi:mannose-6-phosphate isomerase